MVKLSPESGRGLLKWSQLFSFFASFHIIRDCREEQETEMRTWAGEHMWSHFSLQMQTKGLKTMTAVTLWSFWSSRKLRTMVRSQQVQFNGAK